MHATWGSCDGIANAISSSLLIWPICVSSFLHLLLSACALISLLSLSRHSSFAAAFSDIMTWLALPPNHSSPSSIIPAMNQHRPIRAHILYPRPASFPLRSFCADKPSPLGLTLGALAVEELSPHHAFRLEKDCGRFVENAGDGCGMSVYAGHAERWYIERQMLLVLAGVGGIGLVSHVLCAVLVGSLPDTGWRLTG